MQIKMPCPDGVLRIAVLEAKGLRAVDCSRWEGPSSDPYVQITCGAQTWRTPTVAKELNPKWETQTGSHVKDFIVNDIHSQALIFEVFDEEYTWSGTGRQSDLLGQVSITPKELVDDCG